MPAPTNPSEIVVVGSANVDLVATVEKLPAPGETVLAKSFAEHSGGKGSNQAVAAARLGRTVGFVGRTGDDSARTVVLAALGAAAVDLTHLGALPNGATGRALVMVDDTAENSIVVVAGTNGQLTREHVAEAADTISSAAVVVCQLEVPLEAVQAAAELCRGTFILNPAPAQPLEDRLLNAVDILVVNEGEFETLVGTPIGDDDATARERLAAAGLHPAVVVTLGGRGALVWRPLPEKPGEFGHVPSIPVDVVDTTGAGDTFVGALADAIARGEDLFAAVQWAVAAGGLATTKLGATSGMPTRQELETWHSLGVGGSKTSSTPDPET